MIDRTAEGRAILGTCSCLSQQATRAVSDDEPLLRQAPITDVLVQVQSGRLDPAEAERLILARFATEDLGYARIDHERRTRRGFPEVIFGQGKTPDQIAGIARAIGGRGDALLVTRTDTKAFDSVAKVVPDARFHPVARIIE